MSTLLGLSPFDTSLFVPDVRPKKRESVLQDLVTRAHALGAVREPSLLLDTLVLREKLATTAIGKGVAVPNARSVSVFEPRLVLARSRRGIDWDAVDEMPVQLVLLVLSPAESTVESHHDFVGRAVGLVRLQRHRTKLLEAADAETVRAALREASL